MTVCERKGWLLKGSDIVNGVTCRRFGLLRGDSFETYRSESDAKPSSVWPLHPRCEVTPLQEKELTVRRKGKSTLVALVAWKYEKLHGFCFSVNWPPGVASKTNKVVLGFESETLAATWQTGFLEAIQGLGSVQTIISSPKPTKPSSNSVAKVVVESTLEGVCSIPESPSTAVYAEESELETSTKSEPPAEAPKCVNSRDARVASSSTATTSDMHDCTDTQGESECYWCPWQHINGVAVYREDVGQSMDGAFMVSTIVRAPPAMCFQALMGKKSLMTHSPTGFLDMEVLEEVSSDMQIVYSKIEAMGWVGQLFAPREIVAERSWRLEEEDGTYVILMQSTDKNVTTSETDKPQGLIGAAWAPVRVKVKAAGFTIAPLQEKYCPDPMKSPESLVTMVLKIDLGGSCGSGSWMKPVFHTCGVHQAWVECMLMTVVCLRDRVEQSRFVTLPFSVSSPAELEQSQQQQSTNKSRQRHPVESTTDVPIVASAAVEVEEKDVTTTETPEGLFDTSTKPQKWESGTLDPKYWSCPGAAEFKVRGKNYLTDRKKIVAGDPEFELRSVDLVKVDKATPHISRYLKSVRCSTAGFTFVVQIMVPGPPHLGLVISWASKDAPQSILDSTSSVSQKDVDLDAEPSPFDIALMKFVDGGDEKRNDMFKLIPSIVKGSWIIRQSVGSTPVLLGHKLKQYYHRSARYIEVDINVGSSYTAASVVGLVSGATRSLCVDLAIVMEGRSIDELPEALLGTVRIDKLDLEDAVYLDTTKEIPEIESSSPSGNHEKRNVPEQQL